MGRLAFGADASEISETLFTMNLALEKCSRPVCSLTAAVVSEISETIVGMITRAIMAVDVNPLVSEICKTALP